MTHVPTPRIQQLPPESGNWATWLILGGRGSGKNFAAENYIAQRGHGKVLAKLGVNEMNALRLGLPIGLSDADIVWADDPKLEDVEMLVHVPSRAKLIITMCTPEHGVLRAANPLILRGTMFFSLLSVPR